MRWPCLKPKAIVSSIIATLFVTSVFLIIHQALLPVLGWLFPGLVVYFYDLAVYGAAPTETYKTFDLSSPLLNQVAWDDDCDNGLLLLAPFGKSVENEGPVIMDAKGNLVWMSSPQDTVMNLKVQYYRGEPYLTFWLGRKVGGEGHGKYIMLNSSYDTAHTVSATTPDLWGDLHDFIITVDDTALMTIYTNREVDLSHMHRPSDGWITDSIFQEVDIATDKVLFEWRASDFLDPAATSEYIDPFSGFSQSSPYDFFHINSVQKDRDGNYLISSRHLHAIMTISGTTGEILWILGGPLNQFTDLTGGTATNFAWQHDARWIDEEQGLLTIFDNESAGPIMTSGADSLGLMIKIDTKLMTAKLVRQYKAQSRVLSASQGSVQVLDKSVLVGWGSSAAYSEFTLDGELLCEAHFAASSLFWFERVKSYRVLKTFDWIGRPSTLPSALLQGGRVYVSWNGATEVREWQLEGTDGGEWTPIDVQTRERFETVFVLLEQQYRTYRVAAIDKQGSVLSYSEDFVETASESRPVTFWLLSICGLIGLCLGLWVFMLKPGRARGLAWRERLQADSRPRYQKLAGIELH